MSIEFILIIGLIVLMSIILGYIYIKDQEVNTKIERITTLIDPLQKSMFELKNSLNALKIQVSQTNTKQDVSLIEQKLEQNMQEKISEIRNNLKASILENKANIESFIASTNESMRLFKEKTKDFSKISNVVSSSGREDEVISLYKDGHNSEEIAKMLRLGIGEVELTLKLAGVL